MQTRRRHHFESFSFETGQIWMKLSFCLHWQSSCDERNSSPPPAAVPAGCNLTNPDLCRNRWVRDNGAWELLEHEGCSAANRPLSLRGTRPVWAPFGCQVKEKMMLCVLFKPPATVAMDTTFCHWGKKRRNFYLLIKRWSIQETW